MKKLTLVVLAIAAAIIAVRQVKADSDGLNLHNFNPSVSDRFMEVEGADVPLTTRYLLKLNANYLDAPLVELNQNRDKRLGVLVESIKTIEVTGGATVSKNLGLYATVPVHIVKKPNSAEAFGLGDMRFFPKIYITPPSAPTSWALIPEFTFPTGSSGLFVSDREVGYGLILAGERDFGPLTLALNLGYRRAPGAVWRDMDYRSRLPLALGVTIPMSAKWFANLEGSSQLILPFNKYQNPGELYLGVRHQASSDVAITGGVGVGALNSTSSADYRVVFGLTVAPFAKSEPVLATAPAPAPQPVVPAVKEAPARVVFTPKRIDIKEEIKFQHNSDVLTDSATGLLDEIASVIKKNRGRFARIRIEGHTNELGSDQYNLMLSKMRASSVREYLMSRGLKQGELDYVGYGKRKPKQTEGILSHEATLAVNRRVEFKVLH
jgi:outer membrane protein OmpA-like peptidoglycan-associated protein